MARRGARPPWVGRLLLRLRRLGDRREEVETDLLELFRERVAERGRGYAALRYCTDVVSLWTHRRSRGGSRRASGATRGSAPPAPAGRAPAGQGGGPRRPGSWLDGVLLDVRFALRLFRQQIGIVAVTVAGLALAIGATTVVFGFVNVMFLRSFGGADPESAVRLSLLYPSGARSVWWPHSEYLQLRDAARLTRLEAYLRHEAPLGETDMEPVRVTLVSGDWFETFGIDATIGRVLTGADDAPGAAPAVVVNHAFWERWLGGDASIVGRTVRLMGSPFTVVGVIEKDYMGPYSYPPAFWAPLAVALEDPAWQRDPSWGLRLELFGRVADEAPMQQAEAELSTLAVGVASDRLGDQPEEVRGRLDPVPEPLGEEAFRFLALTGAVLGLVLIIACANMANVLLAGALARGREMGLRLALGASRGRVVRQLMTESLMLGAAAGGLGLLCAGWLLPVVAAFIELPPTTDVSPDLRVYGFAVAVTLLASLTAGLAPARHGVRGDLAASLKDDGARGGRGGRPGRTRAALVGLQAAASIVLLVLAALLTRGMIHASRLDLGFAADRLVTVTPDFDAGGYDVPRAAGYWDRAVRRATALPGVEAAAVALYPPFALGGGYGPRETVEHDGREIHAYLNFTSSGYLETLGVPVVRGRFYTSDEVASGAPVAVITRDLAEIVWDGDDALGASLEPLSERFSGIRVIGIVADAVTNRLQEPDSGSLYLPLAPGDSLVRRGRLLVRTAGDAVTSSRPVLEAIRALDPELLPRAVPVREGIREALGPLPRYARVAGLLGAIALGLAVTGVFGLTAFAVEQRAGEIGVRMAVGAGTGDVVRLMLRDSLRPVAAGLAVGVLVALAASRVVGAYLYGLSPRDPVSIAGSVVVLLAAAAAAAAVPTRWAARVDPVVVLRGGGGR